MYIFGGVSVCLPWQPWQNKIPSLKKKGRRTGHTPQQGYDLREQVSQPLPPGSVMLMAQEVLTAEEVILCLASLRDSYPTCSPGGTGGTAPILSRSGGINQNSPGWSDCFRTWACEPSQVNCAIPDTWAGILGMMLSLISRITRSEDK